MRSVEITRGVLGRDESEVVPDDRDVLGCVES